MKRWLSIIRRPASPQKRLEMMTNLILEIGDSYVDMFSFDQSFKLVMNTRFKDTNTVIPTSSVIAQPSAQYNYHDRYIDGLTRAAADFCLVYGAGRYYNDALTEIERAAIASKYFHIIKRNDVLMKYNANVRVYYNALNTAEEKLIELWRLDLYGSIEESGIGLGTLVVEKRRSMRNGSKSKCIGSFLNTSYVLSDHRN